jgi:hypothetical protein
MSGALWPTELSRHIEPILSLQACNFSAMQDGRLTLQETLADPDALQGLIASTHGRGIAGMLRTFGLRPRNFYYDQVREACRLYNLPVPVYTRRMRRDPTAKRRLDSVFDDSDRVREAAKLASPYAALQYLGISSGSKNYGRLFAACEALGVPPPPSRRRTSLPHLKRRGVEITAEGIAAYLPATAADICESLGLPSSKFYRGRVSRVAREGGLQLLRPPRRDTGVRRPRIPAEEIFREGSGASQSLLRRRLVDDGFAQYRCSTPSCPVVDEWLDSPITLQLDHINGDPTDNRVENLRFLCPNCHAQTPTYVRGKGRRTRTLASAD